MESKALNPGHERYDRTLELIDAASMLMPYNALMYQG